jgi:nucleotide-binding universal stress UspA family protein
MASVLSAEGRSWAYAVLAGGEGGQVIDDSQVVGSPDSVDTEAVRGKPDSNEQAADRIVVGIGDSGPDHYRAALALAAHMSRQRDATITLVHGCLPRLSIGTGGALERHVTRGRQLLEEAGLVLSPMGYPSTQIGLAAVPLTGIDALLQESHTAGALIVQRRSLSVLSRTFTGASSHTVAAQAACPVIVVRHDHSDIESSSGVVVGITPQSGLRALDVGVIEAAVRRCPLIAVYVWDLRFSPTYGSRIDPDEQELAEATSWADSLLSRAVAHVATLNPDVDFHARTVKGDIEDGLLQEAEQAELLVVERHRDAHLASIGLGTLTRHLIDQAPCPVMITPQSEAVGHPHDAGTTEPKITTES